MMNIYNGLIRLDARGEAWVVLPDYFEALNRDFRYQLTSVGASQPRLYIASEVKGNRFKIAGGKANAKVSWQVTGIRQDAWANAHRIPNEEEKPAEKRGTYLHPDLFGAAPTRRRTRCCNTRAISWAYVRARLQPCRIGSWLTWALAPGGCRGYKALILGVVGLGTTRRGR